MMFENDLTPAPSLRTQVVRHLPLAAIALGVLAIFFALHLAVTGVVIAGVAHLLVGLVLLGIRRHRATSTAATDGAAETR